MTPRARSLVVVLLCFLGSLFSYWTALYLSR
jgi:hypothetical protein